MLRLWSTFFAPAPGPRPARWAVVLVGLTLLFTLAIRVRLADMPLERDEGEYAYAGQLLLQGVPPYQAAYNMKLPGTYLAYAASMAVFGQTPAGIHLGLALVNAATIGLLFFLARRLLDDVAGVVAAVTFALMSLSPEVLGLAGHATHYVMLPVVGALILLLRALAQSRARAEQLEQELPVGTPGTYALLGASGLLFGLAVLMKQHGAFFGLFGGAYLVYERLAPRLHGVGLNGLGSDRAPRRRAGEKIPVPWSLLGREVLWFSLGCVLPYLSVCVWLWAAGVFPQFWFWTVSYGRQYATGLPLVKAADMFSYTLRVLVSPNLVFWLLPWAGALMLWWHRRLDRDHRFFLTGLLVFSLASLSVGFYFREHYFIQLLPVVALLIAVAVGRSLSLLRRAKKDLESILAVVVLVAGAVAVGALFIGNAAIWFSLKPRLAVERMYQSTLFGDTRELADFIRTNTAPSDRIAVIGSEPQVYFYSGRRSATGHIYTYALMEQHPYAAQMQAEMIREIEAAQPHYVVYVNNPLSWLPQPESDPRIFEWWNAYWEKEMRLVRTVPTRQGAAEFRPQNPAAPGSKRQFPPAAKTQGFDLAPATDGARDEGLSTGFRARRRPGDEAAAEPARGDARPTGGRPRTAPYRQSHSKIRGENPPLPKQNPAGKLRKLGRDSRVPWSALVYAPGWEAQHHHHGISQGWLTQPCPPPAVPHFHVEVGVGGAPPLDLSPQPRWGVRRPSHDCGPQKTRPRASRAAQ